MLPDKLESFFYWVNERHMIYLKKEAGSQRPWTNDNTLNTFKFTNVFRELDRTTVWMRKHFTGPNSDRPTEEIIFNCCLFRMFGTMEFADVHGWVFEWDPSRAKALARERLNNKLKVFTGAYIITNQGLKEPKEQVVSDLFLTPVWNARKELAQVAKETKSLEALHKALGKFQGWGGGGFMAYEVATDLNHTAALSDASDRFTWANAGPGAKRGLNRLWGRPLHYNSKKQDWNTEMLVLLKKAPNWLADHVPKGDFDMRSIEHSLCEWDKYTRVETGEGKPRSLYKPTV